MNNEQELYHSGVPGMRWGFRRYQNKDGSLTALGRARLKSNSSRTPTDPTKAKIQAIKNANKANVTKVKQEAKIQKAQRKADEKIAKTKARTGYKEKQVTPKRKPVSEMTDDEIRAFVNRKQLEESYNKYFEQPSTKAAVSRGSKFVDIAINKVLIPGITEGSKDVVKSFVSQKGKELLKLANDNNGKKKDKK